jgi:hypothetical protein
LVQKPLEPRPERFDDMILFPVVKLVDDSPGQDAQYTAENNAMYFEIKDEISEAFFLIEKEKGGNIKGEGEQNSHEKTRTQKETRNLRNSVTNGVFHKLKSSPPENRKLVNSGLLQDFRICRLLLC